LANKGGVFAIDALHRAAVGNMAFNGLYIPGSDLKLEKLSLPMLRSWCLLMKATHIYLLEQKAANFFQLSAVSNYGTVSQA
jgi:hypothetical protein